MTLEEKELWKTMRQCVVDALDLVKQEQERIAAIRRELSELGAVPKKGIAFEGS